MSRSFKRLGPTNLAPDLCVTIRHRCHGSYGLGSVATQDFSLRLNRVRWYPSAGDQAKDVGEEALTALQKELRGEAELRFPQHSQTRSVVVLARIVFDLLSRLLLPRLPLPNLLLCLVSEWPLH